MHIRPPRRAALATLLLATPLIAIPANTAHAQQQSQEPPPPVAPAHLTRDQARTDTRTFLRFLQATHPDPYTNLGGKIAFMRRAETMIKTLPDTGLTVGDLAARLGMFVAPLHDGHTNVSLYNAMWKSTKHPLPIKFQITADTFFVAASNLPDLRGTRGNKVLGVNGHAMPELLDKLSTHLGTENKYGLYRIMAGVLQNEDLLKLLIPDVAQAPGVTYNLETPAGEKLDRTVSFNSPPPDSDVTKWLEKPVKWSGLKRSDDLFYYRMLDSGRTGHLRVASMGGREALLTYKQIQLGGPGFLHQILQEYYKYMDTPLPKDEDAAIAGIPSAIETGTKLLNEMKQNGAQNLIIDIRGNGGGMTGVLYPLLYQLYGDDYFKQHNPDNSVTVMSRLYMKFFSVDSAKILAKNPDFQIGWYQFNGSDARDDSTGAAPGSAEWARKRRVSSLTQWKGRNYPGMKGLEALDGKPLYHPKNIVVLVDPVTFSAGFQIEFYLQQLGAKLVGVPSSQSPNAFMQVTQFRLPESNLTGSISNSTQVFMPEKPDARVLPMNFAATYSVFRTYGFDEDTSLRYTLDLLAAGKI